MKKNFRILGLLMLFVGTLVIVSCTKDEDDTTGPVIMLNGSATMTVDFKTTFTDPGATAEDDEDGTVTVTVTGTVDVNTAGTYTLTYSATDEAGNVSTAERTVYVTLRNTDVAGTYKTTESCTSGPVGEYNCSVSSTGTNKMDIIFTNFGNFNVSTIVLNATLTGNTGQTVNIPNQVVSGISFTNCSGTVTSNGTKMTITYTATDTNGSDSCTATWNKQ